MFDGPLGCAAGVHYREGVRPAMADDAYSIHAEQRRAAALRVIPSLAKPLECRAERNQQRLHTDMPIQLFSNEALHHFGHAFTRLEQCVPNKAIANDHIHVSAENVATFDVADELERTIHARCIAE